MEQLERGGAFAGLPTRLVTMLYDLGVTTRADLAVWYRAEVVRRIGTRGIGPKSPATIAVWLGAEPEAGGDDGR